MSGALFAQAPIEEYPGVAIETVSDSSRYFVLRIHDDNGTNKFVISHYKEIKLNAVADLLILQFIVFCATAGRSAFIGCGYADRSQAFDLQVSLQDHFKRVKKEQEIADEKDTPKPALDLGFKEGETIKINMKITVKY